MAAGTLEGLDRISGPASAHVLRVEHKSSGQVTLVYLFGDAHFAYDNTCSRCSRARGCYDVVDFIRAAASAAEAAGTSMDVFLELPYVSKDRAALQYIDPYWSRNSATGVRLRNRIAQMIGRKPKYIGMLSRLYTAFRDRMYHHSGDDQSQSVRFHYTDARFEDHAHLITPMLVGSPTDPKVVRWMLDFHRRVPTAERFCKVIEAFTMSRDFASDIRRLMGDDARILPSKLSTVQVGQKKERVNKIAKQFWKLPPGLRAVAERYIHERIAFVLEFLRDVLHYDHHARQINGLALGDVVTTHHEAVSAAGFLWASVSAYISDLAYYGIMLVCTMILMDAYLVCRMLRYLHQGFLQPPSSHSPCIMVYAGDSHITHYVDFLKRFLGADKALGYTVTPVACSAPLTAVGDTSEVNRCAEVSAKNCGTRAYETMTRARVADSFVTPPRKSGGPASEGAQSGRG